jgi:two-component system chemotaxis sensor kinase CheA
MTGDLWEVFLEDGRLHARRLHESLRAAIAGGALETDATDAYSLAHLALLMGVEEIGHLAHTCDRALTHVATASPSRRADLLHLVAAAAAALEDAFATLARPDASGAQEDRGPLVAARTAIERFLEGETEEPAAVTSTAPAPTAPAPTAPAAAPAAASATTTIWVPTVDEDMVEMFFEEANERLEGLAQKLVELERQPGNPELVRDLFRDLHTLKGSSGMVGLQPMNKLAHAAEDLVGQLRDGKRGADRPLVDALLAALDGLRAIVGRAAHRQPIDVDPAPIVARLQNPGAAPPPAAPEAPAPAAAAPAAPAKQTLRVDFDKLDLLLNLVGELVLSKAGLATGIQALGSLGHELESDRRLARRALAGRAVGDGAPPRLAPRAAAVETRPLRELADELGRVERVFLEVAHDLETASGRVDRVSADLRDQVMKLRMVPIGGVFRKYHRTVRDLAHGLGKRLRLELAGEETELDKVLVEQLDDPLLHVVRNAIDHGIESPEARAAAGKPPEGTLRISAVHRGNQIVIEIKDDGAGIDPARIKRKALEKGIARADELDAMDATQLRELIFRPGFSTAATVTDVSGRGVGMDVVRETIVARLKGAVDIDSEVGRGTTFTLRLPLTLAIIQVLLLRAGGEVFAVPLDVIRRTLTARADDIRLVGDRELLAVREKGAASERQIPIVRVLDVLELDAAEGSNGVETHVVLVDVLGATYGLACDRLLGKQEIVIKSLGALLEDVPCAAGATLLGDRPAIILDVPAMVQRATTAARRARPAGAPPMPAPAAAPSRRRILLVEDSDTMRAAMQRALEGAGYEVVPARDGAEGLALATEQSFDLVSTDVMMPNLDGYELTRALRASPRHRDTPIIMVTGRGEKIDRVRGFDAGVDEYITKPHDRQDLLRAVVRHLERKGPP